MYKSVVFCLGNVKKGPAEFQAAITVPLFTEVSCCICFSFLLLAILAKIIGKDQTVPQSQL